MDHVTLQRCSDHSTRRAKTELLHIKFADLQLPKENPIKPRLTQFKSQLFEAKYFADKDSVLVPTDISAVVDSTYQKIRRVFKFGHPAWKSNSTWVVDTRWRLIVQA